MGAGFAGLGIGARLKRAGIHDFVILERAADIGGTWRDNTYPGCACDIPSALYSFSFAQNNNWSRVYPRQAEIHAYLKDCVKRFDLEQHLRLGVELKVAKFDESTGTWRVECEDKSFSSRVLVLATGGLNQPEIPAFAGREAFPGFAFHSSQWDHSIDPTDQRIGVIGTGASAIQIVPELARVAREVVLFQRTPAWVVERGDHVVDHRAPRLLDGLRTRLTRWNVYWRQEALAIGFTMSPRLMRLGEQAARRAMRKKIREPQLCDALEPHYAMGCKRILVSDEFYPALNLSNVRLEKTVAAFDAQGIVTTEGHRVALDGVVYATGFKASEMLGHIDIQGRAGRSLKEAWKERVSAYLGLTVHGFPNLFLMVGPNTGLGHNSIVFMIESQANYILSAVRLLCKQPGAWLEVKNDVGERFAKRISQRLRKTIWATGCNSWYLDQRGQNFALWPGTTVEYWWRTRHMRRKDYLLRLGEATSPPDKTSPASGGVLMEHT